MADILTVISTDSSVVKTWLRLLDSIRDQGVRRLIESKSPIASSFGLRTDLLDILEDEADKEPWLIPSVRNTFKSVCREQFVDRMNSFDSLSQIGSIAFDNDIEGADDWDSLSVKALTSWAYTKGNNAVLSGGVKRGKTNFALLLAEFFLELGWVIVANIKVANAPKDLYYAATLSEMLRVICKARLAGKKVLIILDEGGIFWAKIETVLRRNRAMSKMVLTFGKCDSILLTIHHYTADTPTILARTTVADFEKTAIKNVHINIREGVKVRPRLFTSVPPTKLQYNSEEIQMFTVDLPMEKLFDQVSRLPDGENQWVAIPKLLDKLVLGISDIGQKEVAIWLRQTHGASADGGLSEYDIAKAVKANRNTVHHWLADKNALSPNE